MQTRGEQAWRGVGGPAAVSVRAGRLTPEAGGPQGFNLRVSFTHGFVCHPVPFIWRVLLLEHVSCNLMFQESLGSGWDAVRGGGHGIGAVLLGVLWGGSQKASWGAVRQQPGAAG